MNTNNANRYQFDFIQNIQYMWQQFSNIILTLKI